MKTIAIIDDDISIGDMLEELLHNNGYGTVQLRKPTASETSSIICVGNIKLDTLSREVFTDEQEIHLTKTEFAILRVLMLNAGQTVAKTVLLERIMGETLDCTESSLKQHISNVREKLRSAGRREYISAVWGIGFKLKNE